MSSHTQAVGVIQYPCLFYIKVMGKNDAQFRCAVTTIVNEHMAEQAALKIRETISRNGTYCSLTAEFMATTQQQVDRIYQDLTKNTHVIMAL